jgi:membrane-associated phospholipid phosphatase
MLIESLLKSCPELIVQSAQFLGEHATALVAALVVFWILFAALLWRTFDRRADDFWYVIKILVTRFNSWAPIQLVTKRYPRISLFIADRFSPARCLGLHLTLGLIVVSVTIFVFMQVADEVGERKSLNTFDHIFSVALHAHSTRAGFLAFENISQLGSAPVLAVIVFFGAIPLLLLRQWPLLAGWLTAVVGVGVLDSSLKGLFRRVGPRLHNPWVAEAGWSFPSGHTMATVVVYGFLAYMLLLIVRRISWRIAIIAAFVTIAIVIGFSRIYLGVHYFGDVLAGYVAALGWLAVCVTSCEVARRRRNNPLHEPTVLK